MTPTIEDGTEEVRVPKRGSASGGRGEERAKTVPLDRSTLAFERPRRGERRATFETTREGPRNNTDRRAVEPAAAGRHRPRTARAGRATSTATRSQAPPKRGLDAQYEGMLCTGKVQFFAALIIPIVVMVVIIAAITATA
jgi:hypothetical protein